MAVCVCVGGGGVVDKILCVYKESCKLETSRDSLALAKMT